MRELYLEDKKYILNTYNRMNLIIEKGEGSYLYDDKGNRYLDMYSGISVNNLGHEDKIVSKIISQASKFIHLSNYFVSEPTIKLAKLLVENSFASKVFFANSGTEANEAAIKLCRKYGKRFSQSKFQILSAYNSFHGRTCGGLSLTGQGKYQEAFKPLIPGVDYFKYNDIESIHEKVSDNTCAVFLEIIQGEGGIVEISQEFIDNLNELSKRYNFLIVIDEIQTGIGRTGDLFAFEQYELSPHIVTLAKSLGGGLPLGAMLVCEELEDVFKPGDHGTTFGGNPVACAAGEYVVNEVVNSNMKHEIKEKGSFLLSKLEKLKEKYPHVIKELRGRGLMLGIDAGEYASIIKEKALNKKLLLNVTNKTIIRLLPPLNISTNEIDNFIRLFKEILADIFK